MTEPSTPPRVLGRYELLQPLGQGGMGEVHLARSHGAAGFEKLFIVKTILPRQGKDPQFVERFLHEARVLVQLTHSNIAQVFDMGEADGQFFMCIEYVAGVDVSRLESQAWATGAHVPIAVALQVGQKIAEALGYAHRKTGPDGAPLGIVHRDVSPQNVMVSYEGEVKVIDFGLAKSAARSNRTQSATVLGKLGYLSPEQARAERVDHRSDIYSCGIVLWEMLAGRPLFETGSPGEMLARMANPRLPSLTEARPEISPDLARVVERALAAEPADRYARADDLAKALNERAIRDGMALTGEELGTYVRERCAAEFADHRKLISRLSSLTRAEAEVAAELGSEPTAIRRTPPPEPFLEATAIRPAAGVGESSGTQARGHTAMMGQPAAAAEPARGHTAMMGQPVAAADPARGHTSMMGQPVGAPEPASGQTAMMGKPAATPEPVRGHTAMMGQPVASSEPARGHTAMMGQPTAAADPARRHTAMMGQPVAAAQQVANVQPAIGPDLTGTPGVVVEARPVSRPFVGPPNASGAPLPGAGGNRRVGLFVAIAVGFALVLALGVVGGLRFSAMRRAHRRAQLLEASRMATPAVGEQPPSMQPTANPRAEAAPAATHSDVRVGVSATLPGSPSSPSAAEATRDDGPGDEPGGDDSAAQPASDAQSPSGPHLKREVKRLRRELKAAKAEQAAEKAAQVRSASGSSQSSGLASQSSGTQPSNPSGSGTPPTNGATANSASAGSASTADTTPQLPLTAPVQPYVPQLSATARMSGSGPWRKIVIQNLDEVGWTDCELSLPDPPAGDAGAARIVRDDLGRPERLPREGPDPGRAAGRPDGQVQAGRLARGARRRVAVRPARPRGAGRDAPPSCSGCA